jgi:hypothetical protein
MVVETVFRYRLLVGKCDLGCGLDWEEIDQIGRIEHAFAADPGDGRRRFRRQVVNLAGTIRGDRINDPVAIVEMGPGGLILRDAPFIARGEVVEIVIDDGDNSYRFRAEGVWLRDDGEDYRVGLAFVGLPVCLRKARISAHQWDVIDKIAAAA